ncbi:DUF1499 domain-containing protein [Marinomonas colpomeniae]|uniref:DUF1499 domain-containing protein n=1 Tax=Marinomonas colpomeniae TaxID=2774408 RepID=A0ABR8P0M9_9GAMM|nr:DUF1499 domain-containing protein [Marinomonas colpomeniae]MBD5771841.1 DUF1499 domain-containing protein [Marinomonas colpomeniae]
MSRYISPMLYILLMLVGCMAFISIAGVRIGIFEPLTGFSMLRKSVIASLILSLLAVCSLGICRKERNAASQRFFMLVLTVSLVYSSMWIAFYIQKAELPKINDITTDTYTPPAYMNVSFIRKSNENDVGYNRDFIPIQQKYYGDIKPFYTTEKKTVVYAAVTKIVEDRNWEVVADYTQVGVIEATARTPIFGFRDDVIIRVTKLEGDNVRVDMRSSSRTGNGDYGLNAERVSSFMKDLSKTLTVVPMPTINSAR